MTKIKKICEKVWIFDFLIRIGMRKLAWSLRRLYVPVMRDALVLDVGSGDNPYPRANVLLDAYEETSERHWTPLVKDRPIILGKIEKLPFKDKAFDFIIASHVLEHSTNPEAFLEEIGRVGKAGYIECPDAFLERISPYLCHRLEITNDNDKIIITKKASWCNDEEVVRLHQRKLSGYKNWARFISSNPYPFHMRVYWNGKIKYKITNPGVFLEWDSRDPGNSKASIKGIKYLIRKQILILTRKIFSQNQRNRKIDLIKLLKCPECGNEELKKRDNIITCEGCGKNYKTKNGIPVMYAGKQKVKKYAKKTDR